MTMRPRNPSRWRPGFPLFRVLVLGIAGLLAMARALAATELVGTVERVVDGDTVVFRVLEGSPSRVAMRLRGIDAPESCQAWGSQATQALWALVRGRRLVAQVHGQDEYRRTLATLRDDDSDLNQRLVALGHAWAWRDAQGRSPYLAAEHEAQTQRLGLHAHAQAQPPWEFRREHGRCGR